MQLIDTHVHYGNIGTFDMKLEDVCFLMAKNNVDVAIISSIENAEAYSKNEESKSIEINKKLLYKLRYTNNLFMQYWIRPKFEYMTNDIAYFIEDNIKKIVGLKIHPFLSSMCVTDDKIKPYLDFADKNRMTVAVHTAKGYDCECRYLADVSIRYPNANFIAVHMDLATDHKEAVNYVNSIPNLYGDVSWIQYNEYLNLGVNEDKVIFGSDIPINMETAYDFYKEYFNNKDKHIKLFQENAEILFFNRRKD